MEMRVSSIGSFGHAWSHSLLFYKHVVQRSFDSRKFQVFLSYIVQLSTQKYASLRVKSGCILFIVPGLSLWELNLWNLVSL